VLQEFLDEFCFAYVNDILMYSKESIKEHRKHIRRVLEKLQAVELQLNIDKCEFEVTFTKYLGFIIKAETGIQMNSAKVQVIFD
jgi:hypothetical protein